ncbi:putative MFS family arabinose efflux permease [Kushneria sinocarnis]|uniref:Putative MFS family arabinose efflux permease n=1 Tax=Kushneria sinocarnis TaxID=595502 RepID=A0A420WZB8_9GAMM|nr:MFS transporter [Kushneria sinocarnis]RKR06683.1 putative MFS family arabinose efflux permease [Kushneria sinocarnis]
MTTTTARRPTTLSAAWSLWTLLLGVGLLMLGNGLQSSLLGVRASSAGFGNTITGVVMSAYFVGFLLGSTLTPRKLREVGHVRVFAALASITSVAILIQAIFVDPWTWGAMRFVTGFTYAGLYVVAESWLNGYASNRLRGRLLAIYMVISYLGMGGGQLLLNAADPGGYTLFLLVSMLVSLALVPILLSYTPQPDSTQPEAMGLRQLYRISPLGTAGCFMTGVTNGAVFGMGAVFATNSGLSVTQVAAFMSAFIFGGAVLQWPLGKLSDKADRQWVIVIVASIATALALAGALISDWSAWALTALGALLGGTTLTLYSIFLACANDFLTDRQTIAASASLVLALGIGAILGPFSAGLLMEWLGPDGFLWDLVLMHVVMVLFGLYCIRRHPTNASTEQGHYVVVPSETAPLGSAWTEEAAHEETQLELGLDDTEAPEDAPPAH